jgi:hypothetical protein
MGRFQVMAQSLAVAGDRLVVIVSVELDGAVMVRDLANGRVHAVNPSDLSAPPKILHGHSADEMGIASATEPQWTLALRRKEAICKIDDSQNVSRQIAAIAAEFGVSRRTVFRWHALYRESPQTSALLPRARGTPAGAHRIAAPLDELIAEVIQTVYF